MESNVRIDKFTRLLGVKDEWFTVDMTLPSGKRICANINPKLISNVVEIPYNKYYIDLKFPFIHRIKKTCTKFRQWSGDGSFQDYVIYTIDCNIKSFLNLFGLNTPWNMAMMESEVKYGSHN